VWVGVHSSTVADRRVLDVDEHDCLPCQPQLIREPWHSNCAVRNEKCWNWRLGLPLRCFLASWRCWQEKLLSVGMEVHGCLLKMGTVVDTALGSALITLYGRHAGVVEIVRLACRIRHDAFWKTSLLWAYTWYGYEMETVGVTRGNSVAIVEVKHSGLNHKKSTNWSKISISTSKACCQCLASYRTDLIWSWWHRTDCKYSVYVWRCDILILLCCQCCKLYPWCYNFGKYGDSFFFLVSWSFWWCWKPRDAYSYTKQRMLFRRIKGFFYLQWEVSINTVHLFFIYF
jgi:hypothetical protein